MNLNDILAEARSLCGERCCIGFLEDSDGTVSCFIDGQQRLPQAVHAWAKRGSAAEAWKAARDKLPRLPMFQP